MSVSSELSKDCPSTNQSIIAPIDFNSIEQIPESHTWAQSYDSSKTRLHNQSLGLESIAVINIEDSNVLEHIFHACKNWGIFQISNHGIPTKLLEDAELQSRKLFNLPLEQKMKVVRPPEGATGYGSPRISPRFSKLMWCEGYTIKGDSLFDHAKKLWPNEYHEFCNVIDDYRTRMKALAEKLMGLILTSLEIPESNAIWEIQDQNQGEKSPPTTLQLNSYPSCPDPTQAMGLAQHRDTSLFTIVHQSGNTSGLQAFKERLRWVQVDPKPGTLVVNVGDLLHIISNGRFSSVLHRAVVNNEEQRISLAYFYGLPPDFELCPIVGYEGCEATCFRSLKVKEYVCIKDKHLHLAPSHIRIN